MSLAPQIVFDLFHVCQLASQAVDEVRRARSSPLVQPPLTRPARLERGPARLAEGFGP